jgi:hypothetical protein
MFGNRRSERNLCCAFLHAFCKSWNTFIEEELCFATRIAGTWPYYESEIGELAKSPGFGVMIIKEPFT